MSPIKWIAVVVLALALWWLWQLRCIPATKCRHRTRARGLVHSSGEVRSIGLPVKGGEAGYCLDCIARMTIRCAWCGKPIFIGDRITLFGDTEDRRLWPQACRDDSGRYIGCLRRCCAAADQSAGRWVPPGKVARLSQDRSGADKPIDHPKM